MSHQEGNEVRGKASVQVETGEEKICASAEYSRVRKKKGTEQEEEI